MRLGRLGALGGLVAMLPGCLGSTYRIPRDELIRIANVPPEERGRRVRVVQDIFGNRSAYNLEPSGTYFPEMYDVDAQLRLVSIFAHPRRARRLRRGSGHLGGVGGGGGDGSDAAIVIVAIGAFLAAGLVLSEGARFDGWVDVDPDTPVLVVGMPGDTVVTLDKLEPRVAEWAIGGAYIERHAAPGFQRLERAPLNRAGPVYGFHLGAGALPSGRGTGFTGRPEIGVFPVHSVGTKVGYEATFGGNSTAQAVTLSLQVMPMRYVGFLAEWGGVHEGQGGMLYGGVVVVELPVTTRLTTEWRVAARIADWGDNKEFALSSTLGVAIY